MKNIAMFDEYTAVILAQLYESFPIKKSIDARVICGHMEVDECGGPLDEMGRPSIAFDVVMATIEWLGDNGFIKLGDRYGIGWTQLVLTRRGLELLNAVPESIGAKETFGSKIASFVKVGSSTLAIEAMKAAFSAAADRYT